MDTADTPLVDTLPLGNAVIPLTHQRWPFSVAIIRPSYGESRTTFQNVESKTSERTIPYADHRPTMRASNPRNRICRRWRSLIPCYL